MIDKEVDCLIKTIKHFNLTFSTKEVDCLVPDNLVISENENLTEYAFQKTFIFSWDTEKNISSIKIPKHNLVNIIVDDVKSYILFSYYAKPESNYKYFLNSTSKKVEIRMYSDSEITDDRVP